MSVKVLRDFTVTTASSVIAVSISCKKGCGPMQKWLVWKKLQNTGGGQEMAVMVGQWQKF